MTTEPDCVKRHYTTYTSGRGATCPECGESLEMVPVATEPRQEAERLLDELVTLRELATSDVDYGVPPSEQDADYMRWRERLVAALAAAIEAEDKRRELFAERRRRRDAVEESKAEEAHDEALDRLSEALSALREDTDG